MARSRSNRNDDNKVMRSAPPKTPEGREDLNISLAMNLAEKQLRDGTASSQIIVHYLKLSTVKHQLEIKRMEQEIELAKAKTKSLEKGDELRQICMDAIQAMRTYSGSQESEEDYDEDLLGFD